MTEATALVERVLRADAVRWHLLDVVHALSLPDCWIAAGCVRDAVWNHLHGRAPSAPEGDVDVIWHDRSRIDPALDRELEAALRAAEPSIRWSVKNQARMHRRNGDKPYASVTDAMRSWPETATAVAARRTHGNAVHIVAPFGLSDLLDLTLRPTPRFNRERRPIFEERVRSKRWLDRWPLLSRADAW